MAGHFKRAIRVLDRTGFPLFGLMRSTGKAVPLSVRSRTVILPSIPEGQRRPVRDALHNRPCHRKADAAFQATEAANGAH